MGSISKNLIILSLLFVCLVFCGCGNDGATEGKFITNIVGYNLIYDGDINLGKVALKTDDSNEIIDLYQEIGDNVLFRDSLLIAERYNQGLGANAFAQDNLDMLEKQGLTLSDIKKTQIILKKKSENINAVLVDYKITEGFIEDVPLMYVSQLFIPNENNIELISFVTEDKSSHSSAVKMLKSLN